MIRVDVDSSAFDALIAASEAVDGPAQIAREAAATVPVIKALYEQDFDLKESPAGEAWAPPKGDYGHPLMKDTFALWSSAEVVPRVDGVSVSSGIEYAQYHQTGTPRMVAREILPNGALGKRWDDAIGEARVKVAPVFP